MPARRFSSAVMGSRLVLAVLLVAALVAFGEAQRNPQRPGRPNSTTPAAPTTQPPPPAQLVDAQGAPVNCACQATQEYNPVCGTNGATYNNPSKLRCAQRCGYEVQLDYYGQCPAARTS